MTSSAMLEAKKCPPRRINGRGAGRHLLGGIDVAKGTCPIVEHEESCGRPAEAHGLCTMHYKRQRKYGDPLFVKKRVRVPDPYAGSPLKTCLDCGEVKERATAFQPQPKGHDGLKTICRECRNRQLRERYKDDPVLRQSIARNQTRNRYRLTPADVAALLLEQNGVCALCGGPPLTKGWYIDHDHTCCPGTKTCGSCVRGLLCHRCNLLIGMAEDSIPRLHAAIAYLKDPPMNRLRQQQKEPT